MGLFDNIVLGLLNLVEEKNKTQYMTEDEALNILLEGMAIESTPLIKAAKKGSAIRCNTMNPLWANYRIIRNMKP